MTDEIRDEGALVTWLQRLLIGAEERVPAAETTTLLNLDGQLLHLLVGDVREVSEDALEELVEDLADVEVAWDSDSMTTGFELLRVDLLSRLKPAGHDRAEWNPGHWPGVLRGSRLGLRRSVDARVPAIA